MKNQTTHSKWSGFFHLNQYLLASLNTYYNFNEIKDSWIKIMAYGNYLIGDASAGFQVEMDFSSTTGISNLFNSGLFIFG